VTTLITTPAVISHGGAASSSGASDGCRDANRLAMAVLKRGGAARDAAIAAVVRLEDDGRFNAGIGAIYGLDGESIEMDAAVMDGEGQLGAVASVSRVRNPVLLASAVARTPHCLLVGQGADRLAEALNMPEFTGERLQSRQRHQAVMQELRMGADRQRDEHEALYRMLWNYQLPWDEALRRHGHGTVGTVVRDGLGRFAVATSTGGCAPALLGRVGDTPLIGCGYYVGDLGAIAATGLGEHIMRRMLSRQVYDWIVQGMPLQEALDNGVAALPKGVDIGLIGVTRLEAGFSCNRDMAVDIST
jgi:beta-aspartyl-peptidase (threonine type)